MSGTTVSFRRRSECGVLSLSGEAVMQEASSIYAAAQRAAQDPHISKLRVDLEYVTRLDASSLQILFALAADLRRQGKTIQITGASESLSRTLACVDLTL